MKTQIQSFAGVLALALIILLFFLYGCASQSELSRVQKNLEKQIGQLKSEKTALSQQVDEARSAIAESQNLVSAQKTPVQVLEEQQNNQEYIQSMLEFKAILREQETTNLKSKEFQLLPKENQNQESRSGGVNSEAILHSFLDFAEKKEELFGYSQACFMTDWSVPLVYQTMTKNEAYLRINQLIAHHENTSLAWENCFKSLKEKLNGVWRQFNINLKPLTSDFRSSNPNLQTTTNLLEKSLKEFEVAIEDVYPKIIQIQTNLSSYFRSLEYSEPTIEKSYLSIPENIQNLEDGVFRALRKQIISSRDDLKAFYTLYPSENNALRLSNMEISVALYDGISVFYEEDNRTPEQRLGDFEKEIDLARFLTHQISNDPKTRLVDPGLPRDYEVILKDLDKIKELFWSFKILEESTLDSFQESSWQHTNENVEDTWMQMVNIMDKIEEKLVFLDKKLVSYSFGELKNFIGMK